MVLLNKKIVMLVLIAAGWIACGNQKSDNANEKHVVSVEEKFAHDTILSIPEVTQRNEALKKMSGGQSELSAFTVLRPNKQNDFYWIEILETASGNSITHFNFYYYPSTGEIKFLDTDKEQLLSLPQWRTDTLPKGKSFREDRDYNF